MSFTQFRSALKWSAGVILLVGLASALWIWRDQDELERAQEAAQAASPGLRLAPLDSRKHVRDMEIYYGKLGVLAEQAEELFHGKALAKTIAVGSALTALGLVLAAARLSD